MQIIKNSKSQNRYDTVALTTSSDYIKLFSIPCRTGCSFSLSARISGHDWSFSGTFTAGWNEAGITGTLTQVQLGTKGVYALRALQASDGADVSLWVVFNGDVSGTMSLDITLTEASTAGSATIHDLVRSTTTPGTQRGSIEFHTASGYTIWGTSGTKM